MEAPIDKTGWKDKYTLKEYKQNKDQLLKLAEMLPSPIYLTKLKKVPGFELLSLGIEYYKNEKVIPWYEYTFTEHELVNHDEMLKNIFMDKGMPGIQAYVQLDVPIYVHNHSRQFPDLYRKPNTTN